MKSLTKRRQSVLCWLIGVAMATALYLCLWGFGAEIRYGTTDDGHIMQSFLGFEAGQLPRFHIFLHALLCDPLYWLSTAFPLIPWFSWLQIALCWLACAVTVKSVLQCFLKYGRSFWLGLLASAVYLTAFCMEYCCHVTFTATAAMLGAAAVAQTLSIDYANATDGAVVRGMALSLALLVLAYALRQLTALPILAFCALAFLFGYQQRRSAGKPHLRPFVLSLALVALVLGGLAIQREIDIDRSGMREHLRWQVSSGNVLDYVGMKDVSPETIEKLGWSEAERELVQQWYMLDQNITADAYDALYADQLTHVDQSLAGRFGLAAATLSTALESQELFARTLLLLLLAAVISLCALVPRKGERLWPALFVTATLLFAAGMLCYLASKGRLPLRAMLMPVLPAAGMLFCLLPACLSPKPKGTGKALEVLAACACVALTLWYAVPSAQAYEPIVPDAEAGETSIYADLFEFAQENPDMLIIYDLSLFADTRMFPDLSGGVPQNLLCWGTWTARSPAMYAQLAAFGIDGEHFTASDFLRENVCLASGVLDPPPLSLLSYLQAELGEVDFDYYTSWGGVHIFTFYAMEE